MSFIQEVLERSIYHSIMDTVVEMGYLPDSRDVNTYPNNEQGRIAYKAALQAIIADKGFYIRLFGASNNQATGEKDVPRIVIGSGTFIPGTIGRDTVTRYTPGSMEGYWKSNIYNAQRSTDYDFPIYLVSNKQQHARLLNDIVFRSITPRGYMNFYGLNDARFFIEYESDFSTPNLDAGLIERALQFSISDVYVVDDKEIDNAIPGIIEIDLNIIGTGVLGTKSNLQFPEDLYDDTLIYDNNLIY